VVALPQVELRPSNAEVSTSRRSALSPLLLQQPGISRSLVPVNPAAGAFRAASGAAGDVKTSGSSKQAAEFGKLPPEASPWPLLWSLWPQEPKDNARIVVALGGLLVGKALALWAPLQLGELINTLSSGPEVLPVGLLAAYGLARLTSHALNEGRQALLAHVSQRTCRKLSLQSLKHLHTLETTYLQSHKPGALSTVVTRATKSLQQVFFMLLFQVFPIAVEFAMAMGVLAHVAGPGVVGCTAMTLGSYMWFTAWYSDHRRNLMRKSNDAEVGANSVFLDSLAHCEVVRLFQNEKFEASRYDAAVSKYEKAQVQVMLSLAKLNFGQQFIVVAGFTSILGLSSMQVLAGTMPVGDVVAIHSILVQLMQPLGILGGVYRVTSQGFVDLGKLAGFLQLMPSMQLPPGGGADFDFKGGRIEFRNVHFAHDNGHPILTGASFVVEPGTKVAIVGPSGSGKTTLLKLLYRLLDPQSGEVLLDDQDIKTLAPPSFRAHLGIVPQDCALFNESVGFNIKFGRPDATDEEMERAAQQAQIHDRIRSLPDGYDTPVGERGLKLSGGERQRVGIARCLLLRPSIVLLDEATSALDVQTERHLVEEIDELSHGRTSLIIAHRLSTVQRCDSVAFLEGGEIMAQGTHEELMQRSARYREFWDGKPAGD